MQDDAVELGSSASPASADQAPGDTSSQSLATGSGVDAAADQQQGEQQPSAAEGSGQDQQQPQEALQQQQIQEVSQQQGAKLRLFLGHVPADFAHCRCVSPLVMLTPNSLTSPLPAPASSHIIPAVAACAASSSPVCLLTASCPAGRLTSSARRKGPCQWRALQHCWIVGC